MREHVFASMTVDEVWSISDAGRTLLSSRVEQGRARTRIGARGFEIEASDKLEADEQKLLHLPGGIDSPLAAALESLDRPARVRIVRHARAILNGEINAVRAEEVVSVSTAPHCSVVCTLEQLDAFLDFLSPSSSALAEIDDYRRHPIEWVAGSSSVLMHEAVGHPAERGRHDFGWPEWLSVADHPRDVMSEVDDCGEAVRETELTNDAGSLPWRRSSFRDVPIQRMCSTVVSGGGVVVATPEDRIRVRLLSGGRYEPLTDSVKLMVATAEWLRGGASIPLAPFAIEERRQTIARALLGECGPQAAYPGVICFDEGQRLYVPSRGCGLLTRPFAEVR